MKRKPPPKPARRRPAKSVWVGTFETDDELVIVIRAKRERIPVVNVAGPAPQIDFGKIRQLLEEKAKA